jgi:transposase
MLTPGSSVRVFIAVEPFKMFGSFDALAGATRRLGLDPLDGHFYVFLNRRRHIAKVLWFDKTGWCVFSKRLERGTFQLPSIPNGARQVRVDPAALSALLAGIDLEAPRRRWYAGQQARE